MGTFSGAATVPFHFAFFSVGDTCTLTGKNWVFKEHILPFGLCLLFERFDVQGGKHGLKTVVFFCNNGGILRSFHFLISSEKLSNI